MTTRTFASIAAALTVCACGGEPLRMTSAGAVDMSGARGGAIETRRSPSAAARAGVEAEPRRVEVATTTAQDELAESEAAPAVEESSAPSDERSRRRERRSRRRARR